MTQQEALNYLADGVTLCDIGQFDRDAKRFLERMVRQDRAEMWIDFLRFPRPKKCFRHDPERNKPLPAAVSF